MNNTSLQFTISENKSPVISRYENDLKVGERRVTFPQLYTAFLKLIPIDQLVSNLAHTRAMEFEFYLTNSIGSTDEGEAIMRALISSFKDVLSREDSELFDEVLNILLDHVDKNNLNEKQLASMFRAWIDTIEHLPGDVDSNVRVVKKVLSKLFDMADNAPKVIQQVQSIYNDLLGKRSNEFLDQWVISHLEHVSFDVLESIVAKKTKSKRTVLQTMKPPKDASYMSVTTQGTVYFYDLPANRYIVKYQDVRFENVGHPRLLFAIATNKYGVSSVKLAALKGTEPLNSDMALYQFPFSNVFGDGRVCWSGYQDLELDTIPNMFLSAPANSHLGHNTLQLYKDLTDADFNDDTLKPLNLTLDDWF